MNYPDKLIVGFLTMTVWLVMVYTGKAPPEDFVTMLKAIMGGAVLLHVMNRP